MEEQANCPYCGHSERESWELPDGPSWTNCGECGKAFTYETETSRTYSTAKAPCLNNEGDHDYRIIRGVPPEIPSWKQCRVCDNREGISD